VDEALTTWLNGLAGVGGVRQLTVLLSSIWVPLAVALVLGWRWWRRRDVGAAVSTLVAMALANTLSAEVIKPLVARPRPCHVRTDLDLPNPCGVGKSFPSAHASNAFAVAVAAAPTTPYGWAVLMPLAFLVGLSRVVLGVHYPSDVLAGALLGALVGVGAWWLRSSIRRRRLGPEATSSQDHPDP